MSELPFQKYRFRILVSELWFQSFRFRASVSELLSIVSKPLFQNFCFRSRFIHTNSHIIFLRDRGRGIQVSDDNNISQERLQDQSPTRPGTTYPRSGILIKPCTLLTTTALQIPFCGRWKSHSHNLILKVRRPSPQTRGLPSPTSNTCIDQYSL